MNTENTPVATLKAEFVNEFEFTPRREKVRRFSDETEITHPYTREYEAKVAVKVGNAVKNLTFKVNTHYMETFVKEDGSRIYRDDIKYMGLDEKSNPFEELENAGIEVDYFEALVQYVKMVKEAKYRETLIERYKKWEIIRRQKNALASSWIHKFESTIRADRNKKIQAAVLLTTFTPSTNYSEKHHIYITYKGITVPIHIVDGSYAFNNEKYEYGMKPFDAITGQKVELEDGKLRRAKREGTLFLKAIEAIEIREVQIAYRKKRREEEISANEKTRKILEKAAGVPVILKEEREWNRRTDKYYIDAKYFVLVGQPTDKYDDGVRISLKYSSYNEGQFTVKGLTVREDQFKKILDILIDGREVFKTYKEVKDKE